MDILNILQRSGSNLYYEQQFRILLEDHMTYLKNLSTTRKLEIDIQNAYKYQGDLSGLLSVYLIRPEFHYIVMRMNDFTSPQEYTPDVRILLIPDEQEISRIRSSYKTKNST